MDSQCESPTVRVVQQRQARAIGAIAQTLISKARAGDTTSMIFNLKTQAGWRETAGLQLSAAPLQEQDADPDASFQVFVGHLDDLTARLGQQVGGTTASPHRSA